MMARYVAPGTTAVEQVAAHLVEARAVVHAAARAVVAVQVAGAVAAAAEVVVAVVAVGLRGIKESERD